jgi:hypothetical protein
MVVGSRGFSEGIHYWEVKINLSQADNYKYVNVIPSLVIVIVLMDRYDDDSYMTEPHIFIGVTNKLPVDASITAEYSSAVEETSTKSSSASTYSSYSSYSYKSSYGGYGKYGGYGYGYGSSREEQGDCYDHNISWSGYH